MRNMKAIRIASAVVLTAWVGITAYAAGVPTKFQTDTVQMGVGSSSADKNLIFDTGLGASNPKLGVDATTKNLKYNKNKFSLGDGLSSSKTIEANIGGSNPAIKYDTTAAEWQFSSDGTNFDSFGSGSGGGAGINLLKNPGFESGIVAGWSNTGGTFAAVTSGSNLLIGKGSATFTASASGQYVESTAYTVPNGIAGTSQSCAGGFLYKGGSANLVGKIIDGSSNVLGSATLAASTTAVPVKIYFPCPASGSVKIRVESTASSAIVALDQMTLGTDLLQQMSASKAYGTSTITACSSDFSNSSSTYADVTSSGCTWVNTGAITDPTSQLPAFKMQAAPAGTYSVTANFNMGSSVGTYVSSCRLIDDVGTVLASSSNASASSATVVYPVSLTGNVTYSNVGTHEIRVQCAINTGTIYVGNNSISGSSKASFSVYYSPSAGQDAISAGASEKMYSGATTATHTFTTTADVFQVLDSANSGGNKTYTQLTNVNFGSVSSDGFNLVFTPEAGENYEACFSANMSQGVQTYMTLALLDQSNTIIASKSIYNKAGEPKTLEVCGQIINTSASPTTLKAQVAESTTDSIAIQPFGDQSGYSAYWRVKKLTQQVPAPVFVGSVTTTGQSVERIERFAVTGSACTSSPCTLSTSSGGISSITRNSSGSYTVNFAGGVFSEAPTCVVTADSSGTTNLFARQSGSWTSSAFSFITQTSIPVATDSGFFGICTGKH